MGAYHWSWKVKQVEPLVYVKVYDPDQDLNELHCIANQWSIYNTKGMDNMITVDEPQEAEGVKVILQILLYLLNRHPPGY